MTSIRSAADTGLPENIIPFPSKRDRRIYRPLHADLFDVLSADPWAAIGSTCRVALVCFGLNDDDLAKSIGALMDEEPDTLAEMIITREEHRKALQRCLAMLQAADQREDIAFNKALTARGF